MAVERRQQIEDLYRAALQRPAAERVAFVASRSLGDDDLRRAVEALLRKQDATELRPSPVGIPPGTVIGSYRIDGVLAEGGMGIVCAATDTTLNRPVAVKFLSEDLFDASARRRFEREAQMASALNHPHILTVHAAGEHVGRQYIVTEYVDGGTLHDWIDRRTVHGWRQSVELLIGVADALAAAHDAHILHRDIKPANILVSRSGYAKLADFGLAKSAEDSARSAPGSLTTRTGVVVGTIAYMSPEQASGRAADARSDIFSFGVVLYELLAGRRPFGGATDRELLQNVIHAEAAPLPETVPQQLHDIVEKALEKDPAERYQTMRDFVVDLRRAVRRSGEHHTQGTAEKSLASSTDASQDASRPIAVSHGVGRRRRTGMAVAITIAVLAILTAGAWGWQRTSASQRARSETIPTIADLVEKGDYPAAFALARELPASVRNDPLLRSLRPLFTATFSMTTSPAEAEVLIRGYEAVDDEWQSVGRTPLVDVGLPRRALRWRIEKAGFETAEIATTAQDDRIGGPPTFEGDGRLEVTLYAVGGQPAGTVYAPGGPSTGRVGRMPLPNVQIAPFFIDRYEVTNRDYKQFIDAGGYERRSYWEGLEVVKDGRTLSFDEAMQLFVDANGRPGPATWELGSYPDGRADYPVTGISWYEAAAYAGYRGKSLPTLYHWLKAALPEFEISSSLAVSITPLSNFASAGPTPVGSHQGMGPYGTYDMFGNVREWCANFGSTGGWVIGGSWEDPEYSYNVAAAMPLLERSRLNGLRLMQDTDEPTHAATLRAPIEISPSADYTAVRPVSDEVYATYLSQFAYQPGPLNASPPVVMQDSDDWIKQRATIDTGYDGARMDVITFVPKRATPPFQALVFVSGIQIVSAPLTLESISANPSGMPLDYIVKSGRMLVVPILQGSYNRFKQPFNTADTVRTTREWIERRWDIGRTLDYLATRPDVDASRIGYVGVSWGASYALPLLATENDRFKVALLMSGGFARLGLTPSIEAVNYAPRITVPVLMVNGRYDEILPLETNQRPLFEMLGTPPADKSHVILESGHGSPPRAETMRATLGWLDTYLGPVR
jgi:serine/threonine protein kinase/formylglycine-generating enzyme required for sulfatase activity/dienelactone hydrolase